MKQRLIYGTALFVVSLAFLVADLYYGKPWGVFFLTALLVLWALWELYRMAERRGIEPLTRLGLFLAFVLLFGWWRSLEARLAPAVMAEGPHTLRIPDLPKGISTDVPILLAICLGVLLLCCLFRPAGEKQLIGVAFTALGLVYVAFLGGFALELRYLRSVWYSTKGGLPLAGAHAVILMVVATKTADSVAYLVGSRIGRVRLAPRLSPKKTWEGLLAGAVGSAVVVLLYTQLTSIGKLVGWWQAILFGILMAGLGQAGDLAESYVKRSLDTKDSSSLFPEFGGTLDLIDGILFTAPCSFAFFCWLGFFPG